MLDPVQIAKLRSQESRDSVMAQYLLQREVAFIKQFFMGETRLRRVVEVCSGSGSVALALQRVASGLIGMDINPFALALFQQQSDKTPLILGDALRMPIANESIDCVLAIHCLDYLNRARFLEECMRVLASGGLMIFEASNRNSYKWILKKLQRSVGPDSFNSQNDKWIEILGCDELMEMVAGYGFEILKISGYNWIPFRRSSNHCLVDMTARIERVFKLEGCYQFSPNILVTASKIC
jgi:ubiquinone/menaquinone biosynthesis C-methylase UbiE